MQEHVYDVIVLGTGAAGLTAALRAAAGGARVGLFEKADTVGGTSAWSGGTVWLPNNRHEAELGFSDSREEVLTYLMSLSHGLMEQPLVEAYVDTAPEVAAWLEDNSPVQFETLRGMSDYHPEHPGGKREGRSLECTLFPFADLGDWAHRVTVGWQITGEITMSESSLGRKAPEGVPQEELDRRKLRDERGAGQALVGRLLKGCLDRGVHPQVRCRGVRLLVGGGRVTGGRVTGAGIEGPDGPFEARARGGVVLATGGFEHDERLVRAFLRGPLARAVSVPTNTGDGLRMAMRVGADLADMREAWWVPTIDVDVDGWGRVPWQANTERTRPHTIMVNDDGARFTNEAANYNALGNAFHVVDVPRFTYVNHPAWLVLDHHFLSRYGLAGHRPPAPAPDWIIQAPTIAELAERIGVPGTCLAGHGRAVERQRRGRLRPRLSPRGQPPRPGMGRPRFRRNTPGHARPDRQPALLCRTRTVRDAGYQGRPAHRYAGAGARRRRQRARGPVRRGQRDGLRHGHDLRRTRRHPWARIGVRLPVRASRCRPRNTREPDRSTGLTAARPRSARTSAGRSTTARSG